MTKPHSLVTSAIEGLGQRYLPEDRIDFLLGELQIFWDARIDLFVGNNATCCYEKWGGSNTLEPSVLSELLAVNTRDSISHNSYHIVLAHKKNLASGVLRITTSKKFDLRRVKSLQRATKAVCKFLTTEIVRLQSKRIGIFDFLEIERIGDVGSFSRALLSETLKTAGYRFGAVYRLVDQFSQVTSNVDRGFPKKVRTTAGLHRTLERCLFEEEVRITTWRGAAAKDSAYDVIVNVHIPIMCNEFPGCLVLATHIPHVVSSAERRSLTQLSAIMTEAFTSYFREIMFYDEVRNKEKDLAIQAFDTLVQSTRHQVREKIDLIDIYRYNLEEEAQRLHDGDFFLSELRKMKAALRGADEELNKMAEAATKADVPPQRLLFSTLIQRALTPDSNRIDLLGIRIVRKFSDFHIECFPNYLEHALFHIIQNAVDAFERDSRNVDKKAITIRMEKNVTTLKRSVTFHIEDNAGGIQIDNVYFDDLTTRIDNNNDLFSKGTSSKHYSNVGGLTRGLGLSIVRNYITYHRGSIRLEALKQGTKFSITLPLSVEDIEIE